MKKYKLYTRFLLGILYILIIFVISGCQLRESKHSITFIEDKVIEYSSDFKVSDLIKTVDDYTRADFKISEDDSLITLPNGKTVSVNVTDKKIKLDTIRFSFRYMNENYTKEILIQDTTAPQIECKDVYEVVLNNEYFVLENLITCKDNFTSKEDIEIFFNGSYDVKKEGDYKIQILAYDQKKNKTEKTVKVTVKEEEPIIIEKPSENKDDSPSNNSGNNNSSNKDSDKKNNSNSGKNETQNNDSVSNTKPNSNYKPKSKTFTIDDYSSFDECMRACQEYINECMEKGYQGKATAEPIKEDGIYIGYKAVFE